MHEMAGSSAAGAAFAILRAMAPKKKPSDTVAGPTFAPELAAVLEQPADLAARLAYARSLAPAALGEYVELCARILHEPAPGCFDLVVRAEQLFAANRSEWLAAWGRDGLYALGMYAGLPNLVHVEGDAPAEALARALGGNPITDLRLRDLTTACAKTLMKTPGRERVRSLVLRFDRKRAGQGVKDALAGHDWPCVESVHFADAGWDAADVAALLARMPAVRRVNGGARAGTEQSSRLRELEHVGSVLSTASPILTTPGSKLTSLGGFVQLAEGAGVFPTIERLSLGQVPARGLLACFPNLTELALPFGPEQGRYRESDVDDLASATVWERLQSLRFEGPAASLELLWTKVLKRCQRLGRLHIRSAPCLPEILAALPPLEVLSVDSAQGQHNPACPLTDEDLERLAPYLSPSLRELTLRGAFTSRGVRALIAAQPLGLETVWLASSGFDAGCVEQLLRLPKLRRIYLAGAYDAASIGALRQQPSHGRYLGPPPTMTGPQREAIWSHELVAPAI